MRTSIRRLIQALTAAVLITVGLLIPATTASANGGSFAYSATGHGVGVFERPDVNAPTPNISGYAALRPSGSGDGAWLVCQTTGTGFGGAQATWYLVDSEETVNGRTLIAGYVYAPFFDNGAAQAWLPSCGGNGAWIQVAYPHHAGEYTCGDYNDWYCTDGVTGQPSKNGADIDPGYSIYAQCYHWGVYVDGTNNLWFLSSGNSENYDQTGSYVYAPFLGYTSPPNWMSQCS